MTEVLKENKMGTMPVGQLLLKMSIPMVVSMLVQAIYNIVDSIFVSRVSEEALTAVSLAFPIQNILLAFALGISVGSSALLSRYLGENDRRRVGSIARHGVILSAVASVIFAIIGLFVSAPFAARQGQNALISEYTEQYLWIVTVFSFGLFFQVLAEKLLQATSLTTFTMITQISGALINLILDPILIFGLFGMPALGVRGAAIATVIGQAGGALIGLYFNLSRNHEIKLEGRKFRWDREIVKNIFWIGLPSIVMSSIGSIVIFILNLILKNFGQSAIAAYGVMFKFQTFAFLPVIGIANALTTIVAYNYGARKKDRILESIALAMKSSFILVSIAIAIMWIFPSELLSFFNATDEMMRIGVPMMRIASLSYFVAIPSIIAVSGVFQALGNWKMAILQSFLRQLIILVPVFYLLSKTGKLELVWWSFFIAEALDSMLCIWVLRKEIKTKIEPLDEKPILKNEDQLIEYQ